MYILIHIFVLLYIYIYMNIIVYVGRVFASIPWGMFADRYGRKACLLCSMFNVALFGIG